MNSPSIWLVGFSRSGNVDLSSWFSLVDLFWTICFVVVDDTKFTLTTSWLVTLWGFEFNSITFNTSVPAPFSKILLETWYIVWYFSWRLDISLFYRIIEFTINLMIKAYFFKTTFDASNSTFYTWWLKQQRRLSDEFDFTSIRSLMISPSLSQQWDPVRSCLHDTWEWHENSLQAWWYSAGQQWFLQQRVKLYLLAIQSWSSWQDIISRKQTPLFVNLELKQKNDLFLLIEEYNVKIYYSFYTGS